MIPSLKAMGTANLALRLMARRGHGDWVAGGVPVFSLAREQRRMATDFLHAGLSERGRSRVPRSTTSASPACT